MLCVQGLLRELLIELDRQDPRRTQVLEAYGEQLAERNLAEDSAVAYLAAGALERSLLQYKLAGQWQMAFCLAGARSPILWKYMKRTAGSSHCGLLLEV